MKHYYVITTYNAGTIRTRNQADAIWFSQGGAPPASIMTYRVIDGKLRCFSGLLTANQAEEEHLSNIAHYAKRGIDIA